jgi:hypothetical protein
MSGASADDEIKTDGPIKGALAKLVVVIEIPIGLAYAVFIFSVLATFIKRIAISVTAETAAVEAPRECAVFAFA